MKKIADILKTMRPKQWIKNTFVLAALIFSKSFMDTRAVILSFTAFILFCLASGAVYIINDIIDRDKDKLHPRKCKRPIASGRLKVGEALSVAVVLLVLVIALGVYLSPSFAMVLVAYIVTVMLYSFVLKHQPILDIMAIAAGFLLRVLSGAVIIGVEASSWLLLCTTALCLFLAANKRKSELDIMKDGAKEYKATLGVYTSAFLQQVITICLALCIVLYSLYAYFTDIPYMMATVLFVIYGLFRYQLLVLSGQPGDNIEVTVLKDKPLLTDLILWGLSCLVIVWKFY